MKPTVILFLLIVLNCREEYDECAMAAKYHQKQQQHFTMKNKTPNSYLSHSWGCNKPHTLQSRRL